MKCSKRIIFMLAMVLCLGVGITAFATTYTYAGNLMYKENKIGSGELKRVEKDKNSSTRQGVATTYAKSAYKRYSTAILGAYKKNGTAIATSSGTGSLTAVASIHDRDVYKYKSTHSIKRSSDSKPLASTTLYSYK